MNKLLSAAIEGTGCALQAIITNLVRSLLITLGVVVGVASVVAAATILQNVQSGTFSPTEPNLVNVARLHFANQRPAYSNAKVDFSYADFLILKQAIPDLVGAHYKTLPLGAKTQVNTVYSQATTQVVGAQSRYQYLPGTMVQQGRFITAQETRQKEPVAFIGPGLAQLLNLKDNPVGRLIFVNNTQLTVVGVGLANQRLPGIADGNYLIVPHTIATQWSSPSSPGQAEVLFTLTKSSNLEKIRSDIQHFFAQYFLSPPTLVVEQMPRQSATLEKLRDATLLIAGAVAAISLMIGGLGITNIMLVAVTQRTVEISMARAMGASKGFIMTRFLTEAGVLALFGGAIGIAVGYLLSVLVMLFLPTEGLFFMPLWTIILAITLSLMLGIIFGLIPAIKAAQLDPADTLYYE